MGQAGVDAGAPLPPGALVGFERGPGGLGVGVEQRPALGDADRDGERAARADEHRHGPAGFDIRLGDGAERQRQRRPAADEHMAAVLHPRCPAAFTQAGVELDGRLGRRALSREPPHEQRCRQLAAGHVGDHGFGESEEPALGPPGGLDGGGAGPVAPRDDRRRADRTHAEAAGRRPAYQSAKGRLAVEAGHAQPVDAAIGGHQGGAAGVAEQAIVADRRLPAWLSGCRPQLLHVSGP